MKVGIIGGLGPLSTAAFYERIVNLTDALNDQDHIETIIWSNPNIPKRVEYILGQSEDNPATSMREIAINLEKMGADLLAMPCVTAHYFYEEINSALSIPFINMIDETISVLKEKGINKVGILGTLGTKQGGHLQRALNQENISYIWPDEELQNEVNQVIFGQIKQGKNVDLDNFQEKTDQLFNLGAQNILLACTELSTLNLRTPFRDNYLDMMKVLAKSVVIKCGKSLREE